MSVSVTSCWDKVAIPDTREDTRKVVNDPVDWKYASTSIWFWVRYIHLPKLHSMGEKIHSIKLVNDTDDDGVYD